MSIESPCNLAATDTAISSSAQSVSLLFYDEPAKAQLHHKLFMRHAEHAEGVATQRAPSSQATTCRIVT